MGWIGEVGKQSRYEELMAVAYGRALERSGMYFFQQCAIRCGVWKSSEVLT